VSLRQWIAAARQHPVGCCFRDLRKALLFSLVAQHAGVSQEFTRARTPPQVLIKNIDAGAGADGDARAHANASLSAFASANATANANASSSASATASADAHADHGSSSPSAKRQRRDDSLTATDPSPTLPLSTPTCPSSTPPPPTASSPQSTSPVWLLRGCVVRTSCGGWWAWWPVSGTTRPTSSCDTPLAAGGSTRRRGYHCRGGWEWEG
jgi:hypothetical protein